MIKDIFIPEKLGTNYLFPKRIVGFDIGTSHVTATQVHLRGTKVIIEKTIEEQIEQDSNASLNERIGSAISAVAAQLDKYDEIRSVLPAAQVVFKKLRLPFTDINKLKMVVGFEVEPLLPFPAHQAIIDFIILDQDKTSSELLVVAAQDKYIAEHLALFEQTGLTPDILLVDALSLYGLFLQVPAYHQWQGSVALIDLGSHDTQIIYIINQQLMFVRSIPHGIVSVAKSVAQERNISPKQALEQLIRFGLQQSPSEEDKQAAVNALNKLWQKINFTLSSFNAQMHISEGLNHIVLLGGGAQIKGITEFVSEKSNASCELFSLKKLLKNPHISFKNKINTVHSATMSIAAALPSPTTAHNNLRQKEFAVIKRSILTKQLITSAVLFCAIIGSLVFHSLWQQRKIRNELHASQEELLEELQDQIPGLEDTEDLEDALSDAQRMVQEQEKRWFAFSSSARASSLKYLLELTRLLDKKNLELKVDQIIITDKSMIFKGSVKDHRALVQFENRLRDSNVFGEIPPLEDPFAITIEIPLKKNTGA